MSSMYIHAQRWSTFEIQPTLHYGRQWLTEASFKKAWLRQQQQQRASTLCWTPFHAGGSRWPVFVKGVCRLVFGRLTSRYDGRWRWGKSFFMPTLFAYLVFRTILVWDDGKIWGTRRRGRCGVCLMNLGSSCLPVVMASCFWSLTWCRVTNSK